MKQAGKQMVRQTDKQIKWQADIETDKKQQTDGQADEMAGR